MESIDLNHAKRKLIGRGEKEDDWTRVMMSVLRLRACESSNHVKNRKAVEHPGKQADK